MMMEVFFEIGSLVLCIGVPLLISCWAHRRSEAKKMRHQKAAHDAYVADLFRQIA